MSGLDAKTPANFFSSVFSPSFVKNRLDIANGWNRKPWQILGNRKRAGGRQPPPHDDRQRTGTAQANKPHPGTGRAGNRVAEIDRAAYAFEQMNAVPKSIYLFLSPEKDFASFCCILTKTLKPIETIESIGVPLFSMLS